MTAPPILRQGGWPGLLAELAARPGLSYLRDIPAATACAVLAAPAAAALWISARAPHLARKSALSLLVIGAETTDAPDNGRWYQLLAHLLDSRCAVTVTLIGSELDTGFASSAQAQAPPAAARCVRLSLGEFLDQHAPSAFDLAVVFQPGLQKHREWLADAGFARLLAGGVPLVASSYETDEFEMDRWVLECYGYRASAQPLLNPFFLELGDDRTRVRWGRALWQFESGPSGVHPVDRTRLTALDNLTRMVMHSMTESAEPAPPFGSRVELETGAGSRMTAIHVFDNRFVETASGRVWRLDQTGELTEMDRIPADALARYPAAARDIERAVWAAEIKCRYLLASYPPPPAADAGEATARGMLSAMREKAANLFRK